MPAVAIPSRADPRCDPGCAGPGPSVGDPKCGPFDAPNLQKLGPFNCQKQQNPIRFGFLCGQDFGHGQFVLNLRRELVD